MDLRDYWRIVQRRWVVLLACVGLTLGAAIAITAVMTPQYASTARLFISTSEQDSSTSFQGGMFAVQRVASYADLVQSRELAEAVGQRLDLDDDASALLPEKVQAEVVPETVILQLRATDPSPERAQIIAQAYAEELQELVRQLETPPGGQTAPIKATVVDAASLDESPVSPQPVRNVALGLAIGLALGLALAIVREAFDNTVKSPDQVSELTGASVLGTIAFDPHTVKNPLITDLDSHAPRFEAFRVLRTNMQFLDVDAEGRGRMYVVSSPLPGEGKTTTATNLALTLAQAGEGVLLVEADLRRPRVTNLLGLDDAVGLTSVLVGKVSLGDAFQAHRASGLTVLAAGAIPPNPAELIQSKAMSELLDELRDKFSLVIVDAPPLLPVTDAALLGARADGVLLVIRHGRTTVDQVTHAVERVQAVDARTVGVVLNMVPVRRGGHYGYGYGYDPDAPEPRHQQRAPRATKRSKHAAD